MIGVVVSEMSQAGEARRKAAAMAQGLGLGEEAAGRVSIVVTEAATNLIKHAGGGQILLCPAEGEEGNAVTVLSLDRGPGMDNLSQCEGDGYSSGGTMGTGLGAIRRLSTEFEIHSSPSGTILLARVGDGRPAAPSALRCGAVCVPCPGEEESGDGWAVVDRGETALALVVDGLGHGHDAALAAREAERTFHEYSGLRPVEMLEQLHQRLRPTRGAVAGVVELDRRERHARYCGVGNISGSVLTREGRKNVVSHHGTLGHGVRKFHEFVYPWPEGSIVVLHSDGVSAHWDLGRYPGLASRRPILLAAAIYRDFHRTHDDATVLVAREAA